MPNGVSASGDVNSANLNSTGGPVLQGYVHTNAPPPPSPGYGQLDTDWSGSPLLQTGIRQDVINGDTPFQAGAVFDGLIAGISGIFGGNRSPLQGKVEIQQNNPPPIITTQVVKADIRTNVVQPIEPCRSIPYLKLIFLPVDEDVRMNRELRRETSIPVPVPQAMTITDFKAIFAGHVHIKDTKYLLRWKQVLPVVVEPQDSGSVDYKSVDIYDLRTSILLDDDSILSALDFSQLPLIQVTAAQDIIGGTLDPELEDYELYLDDVIFADVEVSTGRLIAKNPVEVGLFTGP